MALFACKDDGDTITTIEYTNTVVSYSNIDSETGLPTSGGYDSTVRVHDPMTVFDSSTGKWYVFGSHFAVASSTDLVHWTQEVDGSADWSTCVSEAQELYGSDVTWWSDVLKDSWDFCAYDASGNTISESEYTSTYPSTWAPSVIKINGTWYMYYSYTSYFSGRSVIGRVSSSSILGPYGDNEIILVSEGSKSGTGGNGPNCIDQEVFYDQSGELWMVYGSWYGGVFLIQLEKDGTYSGFDFDTEKDNFDTAGTNGSGYFWSNATTTYVQDSSYYYGLTNSVYGKRLWYMGYRWGVEGPFIFYNDDTEYYYLMTSEGDLSSVYNMRIARSETVDGDYMCIQGGNVTSYTGTGGGRVGNKLAGNFKWEDDSTEYWALGHNSVIKKENSDGVMEYFVVCHARVYNASNHHLEVHQLYFNNEGWPVMSPNRYVGESLREVTASTIAGSYDVIEHEVDTVEDVAESVEYYFDEGGTIYTDSDKGTKAGSWALVDGSGNALGTDDEGNAKTSYYITVTLGTDSDATEYNGVVAPGWRNYNPKGVWCITATSDEGRPMWANQAD